MAEFFGDLERLAADLYPYRWPILAGILIVIAVVAVLAYQMGLHLWVNRHKVPAVAVGVPLLALMGFIAWDLGSPLFTNVTVEEEFPFSFSATVPQDMDREKVEDLMAHGGDGQGRTGARHGAYAQRDDAAAGRCRPVSRGGDRAGVAEFGHVPGSGRLP